MNKEQKIISLANSMEVKERTDKTEFTCFSDNAPEELKAIFLSNYEVRDTHYQIFSKACDIISELLQESPELSGGQLEDDINERVENSFSVYTSDQLDLLDNWNNEEIAEIVKDHCTKDISTACAIWFDREVTSACHLINDWVNE